MSIQQLLMASYSEEEPAPGVSFVGAGAMSVQAGVTTVSPDCPTVEVGDLLVAAIMRRSAVASDPPSGWTLISSAGPANDGAVTDQWTQLYTKTAVGSEGGTTVTFSQSSAGRMIGQIIALRGNTGTPVIDGAAATNSFSATTTNQIALPAVTASVSSAIAVAIGSFTPASVSPNVTTFTLSSWTIRSPVAMDQNRMCVATKSLSSGAETSGTLVSSFEATTSGGTANAVIFKDPSA